MAKNSVFEIDTKGTCLFCLNPKCAPLDRAKFNLTTATALKMLFRYLNIDIRNVAKISSVLSAVPISMDSCTNLVASLCDACFFLVDEFLQLFQNFERVRLQLEACTWKLKGFILARAQTDDNVREYRRRVEKAGDEFQARFVDELRKETFAKCCEKSSSSLPRIGLIRKSTFAAVRLVPPEAIIPTGNKIEKELRADLIDTVKVKVEDQDVRNIRSDELNTPSASSEQVVHVQVPHTNLGDEPETSYQTKINDVHLPSAKSKKKKITLLKCSKCNLKFRRADNLIRHYRSVHQGIRDKNLDLKCDYCPKYFSYRPNLRVHKYLVHPVEMLAQSLPPGASDDDVKQAVEGILFRNAVVRVSDKGKSACPLCSKLYSCGPKLRAHIIQFHKDQVCQSILQSQQGRRRKQVMTPSPRYSQMEMETVVCLPLQLEAKNTATADINVFQKTFTPTPARKLTSSSTFMPRLSKAAYATKNVPCDICGKKFRHFKYLRAHKNKLHFQMSGAFKCGLCDRTFLWSKTLQRHYRVMHLKIPLDTSYTIRCEHCDKGYANRTHLQRHLDLKHPKLVYSDYIPGHISEEDFDSAVTAIAEKIRPDEQCNRDYQKGTCIFCGRKLRCCSTDLRVHIVRNHLEKVVEEAGGAMMPVIVSVSSKTELPSGVPIQLNDDDDAEMGFELEGEGDEMASAEDPLAV